MTNHENNEENQSPTSEYALQEALKKAIQADAPYPAKLLKKRATWVVLLVVICVVVLTVRPARKKVMSLIKPPSLTPLGEFECTNNYASYMNVAVQNDLAYVTESRGLAIADISHPLEPNVLGRISIPDTLEDLKVLGPFAYIAGNRAGLFIIDISDPSQPLLRGIYKMPRWATGVDVIGSLAYITDNSSCVLHIVNVANPSSPILIGSCSITRALPTDIVVSGSHAYLSLGFLGDGMVIVDVSKPSAPTQVGFYPRKGSLLQLCVSQNLLYATTGGSGLDIIDISNPLVPTQLGHFHTVEWPWANILAVSGNLAIVQHYALPKRGSPGGFQIIDISDPRNPKLFFQHDEGIAIGISGSLVFATNEKGVKIFSLRR